YTGNGISCSDINECELNNGGCSVQPFVQCSNTVGSRVCGPCPTGYVGNGVYCTFVGVCNTNRGGCHPLATCIENTAITGTYRECRCPSGYTGSGEGPNGCLQTAGLTCDNNPCRHGTCLPSGQSFRCVCNSGYLGTLCDQEEIDVCFSSPCENGGTCVRTANSFRCICVAPYEGPTCAESAGSCGGHIVGTNGTIQFPEAGTAYDHMMSCAWVITVPPGKTCIILLEDSSWDTLSGHGSLVVNVMDSRLACYDFEPSTTEDLQYKGAMHVKSVENSNFIPLVRWGLLGQEVSAQVSFPSLDHCSTLQGLSPKALVQLNSATLIFTHSPGML
ncbi:cubilin, partial [Trichonephila clavipes]